MPVFTIETPSGKRLKIEAADEGTAMRGAQEWESQQGAQAAATAKPVNPFEGKSEDEARSMISQLPAEQRDAAYNSWADAYVAKEREQGGVGMAIDNAVRGLARGTPIGSWLDEANAAMSGVGSLVTGNGFDQGYNESVAYQRAKDRAFDEANPITSTGLQIAGGVGSAVAAAPAIIGGASSLGGAMVQGAKAGAAGGAVYGAGLGEGTLSNRAGEAAQGAVLGGALGGVAPAIARGAGNLVGYVANRSKPVPAALAPYEREAVRTMSEVVGNSGLTKPGVTGRLADLGQDAITADLSRPLEDLAGGIAATPMRGAQTVFNAVKNRAGGAEQRVVGAVDNALGGKQNVPKLVQSISEKYKVDKNAAYKQFRETPVPPTFELDDILETLKNEPQVLRTARRITGLKEGIGAGGTRQFFADIADDGTVTIKRVPNAVEYDQIKKSLDLLARKSPEDGFIYGSLSRRLRQAVDEAISPNDPSQSIYAKARALSAEEFEIKDALEAGKSAFARNLSPDEMAAELADMSQPAQDAYRIGARQSVRNTMENSATKFGQNADTAGMRMLGSQSARAKIDTLNPGASRELSRILDAEGRFAATEQNVLQNSRTAARQAAQQMLPKGAMPRATGAGLANTSISGIVMEGVARTFNALRGGAVKARAENVVADMAAMLTAQGATAGQIVKALIDYNRSLGASAMGADAVAKLVKAVVDGSRQAAVSSASQ